MELKNCPFCGGEPEMLGGDDVLGKPFWYVSCMCTASTAGAETKEEAAAKWNRRVSDGYKRED